MPDRVRSPRGGRVTPKKAETPEPSAVPADDYVPESLPAHLLPPEVKIKDEGRKPDMPQAPIIFIAGEQWTMKS